jgi:hypothetical protein
MPVLSGKFLDPANIEQEPLRAFIAAHFLLPAKAQDLGKRDLAQENLLLDPGNQAPCVGAVGAVLMFKLRAQQILFSADTFKNRWNKQQCEKHVLLYATSKPRNPNSA